MLEALFGSFFEGEAWIQLGVGHYIFVGLLAALFEITSAFGVLAGIGRVTFNGEEIMIFDLFFTFSPVAAAFWGVTAIGLALAGFFSISLVAQKAIDLKVERTMGMVLGQIGRTMLTFFIVPAMCMVLLHTSAIIMQQTNEMFARAHGGGADIDRAIFAMMAREAVIDDASVVERFALGELDYMNAEHVIRNTNHGRINVLMGIPLVLALLCMYIFITMVMVLRIFSIILLYLVSPLFVSSMVLDDGKNYGAWRRAFIGKLTSGLSLLISVNIIGFIIVPFLISDTVLTANAGGDVILKFLLVLGSVYGAYKSAGMMSKIISPEVEGDDKMLLGFAVGATVGMFKKAAKVAAHAAVAAATSGASVAGSAKSLVRDAAKDMTKKGDAVK